jgi:hypothetical protein
VLPFLIPSHIQSAICELKLPSTSITCADLRIDALAEKIADAIIEDSEQKTGLFQEELKF